MGLGTCVRFGAAVPDVVYFPVVSAGIALVRYFFEDLDCNDVPVATSVALVITGCAILAEEAAAELTQ
jgi:hypothetical protein